MSGSNFSRPTSNAFITGFEPVEPGGPRIGVLAQDGTLFVKEGAVDVGGRLSGSRIVKFAVDGDRIGVLTQDANLFVKQGTLFGTVFMGKLERAELCIDLVKRIVDRRRSRHSHF